jgi:hypothetical protein
VLKYNWFASAKTTMAMEKELGCKFLGPAKTATAGFPQESTRHALRGAKRGTTVVFEERKDGDGSEPIGRRAIGWNDHWCKGFMTNHGSTKPGKRASKKRQRSDGRNCSTAVDRRQQLEHCHEVAGHIDRHNRYRQHALKFHKTWKTKKWQTRMMLEIVGTSLVDACRACRHLMPTWRDRDTTESNFMAFVMDLMPQVDARTEEQLDLDADESSSEAQPDLMSPVQEFTICAHASVGKNGVRSNDEKHTNQQRFKHCSLRGRKNKHKHAHKTSWCCRARPDARTCKYRDRPCMAEHMAEIADLGE